MSTISQPTIVVLFGATGDLARLKILPALRELWIDGRLPRNFRLLCVGRREFTTDSYLKFLADIDVHPFRQDISMLRPQYVDVNFAAEDGFAPLRELLDQQRGARVILYMAVGPDVLEMCIDQFSQAEFRDTIKALTCGIVVEKPFGEDLVTARDLNRKLNSIFGVRNIYRNDHYLNKSSVQSIIPIRESDSEMQAILTTEQLAEVQVVVAETVDLGTRASYFDCRGMVVDWMQSHMLQLLATLCADLNTDNLNTTKAEFIDSLQLSPHSLIRAQYEGYAELPAVDDQCETETFFAVQYTSDQKRWQGVTFSMIAGKAMAEKEVLINLRLRHPHPKLGSTVTLQIDPVGGHEMLKQLTGEEYQHTLLQAIHDDWDKFISQQEVEAQWRVTERTLAEMKAAKLELYPKGTSYKHFCTDTWCISV